MEGVDLYRIREVVGDLRRESGGDGELVGNSDVSDADTHTSDVDIRTWKTVRVTNVGGSMVSTIPNTYA